MSLPSTSLSNLVQSPIRPAIGLLPVPMTLLAARLSCGFPSPSADVAESRLDLNTLLVQNTNATFFFRVQGDSMAGIGLVEGSYLVVDRSIPARSGHVVVAIVNAEYTVKRLVRRGDAIELHSENPKYPPIVFAEDDELTVWGVVTGWAHRLTF